MAVAALSEISLVPKKTEAAPLSAQAHTDVTFHQGPHYPFMTTTPNDRDLPRKRKESSSGDRRWDVKQGTPKDPGMAKVVERASGRYSASEQSEKKSRKG